jgi:predicted ATPase
MIKRIRARNFLSLKDIDLELGPRNTLVGPNMSGKSNLLECFKFLRDCLSRRVQVQNDVSSLNQAFDNRGGFEEVVWKGQPQGPIALELIAEIEDSNSNQPKSYNYQVRLRRGEYALEVEGERLTVQSGGRSETIIENGERGFEVVVGTRTITGPHNSFSLALETYARHPSFEGSTFLDFVNGWRFYHLVPALMRESNPPSWESQLSEHGENLSAWILTVQNGTKEFARIKQVCRDVLPDLAEILFQPVDPPKSPIAVGPQTYAIPSESAKISIGVSEAHFKKPISISRMSDGELAFLALMSLILASPELSPSLLCIEEPENYLHPRLLEILVELLNQRQAEPGCPQVILTTHSPLLVDKLSIDELIVAGKVEGATTFTRASSKKRLRELLSKKEVSLGDLWYSGALSTS